MKNFEIKWVKSTLTCKNMRNKKVHNERTINCQTEKGKSKENRQIHVTVYIDVVVKFKYKNAAAR